MRNRVLSIVLWSLVVFMAGCAKDEPPAPVEPAPPRRPEPVASTTAKVRNPGPAFQRFAMPGVQGLIVGETEAGRFYAAITGSTAERYFTPDKSTIIALESRLPAYLRSKAPAGSGPRKRLRDYRRQYLGVRRDGKRLVFANFFCETHRTDWTRKPIAVDDGGDCYFQVLYNPKRRSFSGLVIQKES